LLVSVFDRGACIDTCLSVLGEVTRSFWLHNKSSSLDMRSIITVVEKHAEMSVKNDASDTGAWSSG